MARDEDKKREPKFPYGYVHPFTRPWYLTHDRYTSQPYPLINADEVTVSLSFNGVRLVRTSIYTTEMLTVSGDLIGFTVTQTFFPVEVYYQQEGQPDDDFADLLTLSGDLIGFNLGQEFFPIEVYYQQEGQPDDDFADLMTVSGDLIGFNLGAEFFPIEINYKQDGQDDDGFYEGLSVSGDLIGFDLGPP